MRRIYSTETYRYLRDEILGLGAKMTLGRTERKIFPDGEKYRRITDNTAGDTAYILSGLDTDSNFMEVLETAIFLVENNVKKLNIIVPYFGYSTMERAAKEGEFVKAKYRADILSRLPRASYGNRIIMMDLHAEQMIHYFHDVTTYHINNRELAVRMAADMVGVGKNYVIAATDVGRAKHIEYLSRISGMEPAYVYKRRDSGTNTEVTGANCDVQGKEVVVYDDMIRSGGSLLKAVQTYKHFGAEKIYVAATHVPMRDGVVKLIDSGMVEKISIMNTTPIAVEVGKEFPDKVKVYSVAANIADFLDK
jgi:ribose-phosphate pyrophosphokinase